VQTYSKSVYLNTTEWKILHTPLARSPASGAILLFSVADLPRTVSPLHGELKVSGLETNVPSAHSLLFSIPFPVFDYFISSSIVSA
jgi:hypothetical protein